MLINPYNYKFPVDTAEMFFGRRVLLDEFVRNFTGPKPDSYYLVGGRRMGKTSLLMALSRELSAIPPRPPAPYTLPLYLDLQYEQIDSRRDFFACVIHLLHEALCAQSAELQDRLADAGIASERSENRRDSALLDDFEEAFVAIRRAVLSPLGTLQVVLLIDESERMLGKEWAHDLLSNLRALLSNRPRIRGYLTIIMAGASDFYHRISGEGSPLRNILTKKLLEGLDTPAVYDLVTRPIVNMLPEVAVEAVIAQSGGHPFLTQYMMYHLCESDTLSDVDTIQVQAVAQTIWETPETLEDWCADIGATGQAAYMLINRQEGWVTREVLFDQIAAERGELRRAIEALTYHGLVHHNPRHGYRVAGVMFRDWFMAEWAKAQVASNQADSADGAGMIYHDFAIWIAADGSIHVTSDEGEADGQLSLNHAAIDLALRLLKRGETDAELLKSVGSTLYQALFADTILACFHASKAAARKQKANVRLRLIFEAPTHAVLPWELLYDATTFLAQDIGTALSRYLQVGQPRRPIAPALSPLRLLLIVSRPSDMVGLDVTSEVSLIQEALAPYKASGRILVDLISKATVENLHRRLTEQVYHVVHFVGHAFFADNRGQVVLLKDDGTARPIDDETFGGLFLNCRSMGLVILNACQGAEASAYQSFAGVAPRLVEQGIPAVIAMQYPILDATAKLFAAEFYHKLALGWPVDAAIQATRNAIAVHVGLDRPDFATPVLFMRARDGRIL